MPKKNSKQNPYRRLLIKEVVKTSKVLAGFMGEDFNFDPYSKEETYESWSIDDLENSIREDINTIINDWEGEYTLPDELSYLKNNKES